LFETYSSKPARYLLSRACGIMQVCIRDVRITPHGIDGYWSVMRKELADTRIELLFKLIQFRVTVDHRFATSSFHYIEHPGAESHI
jgi:hypothetical protein